MLERRMILVVEDEYYIADDLATVLRSSGADVLGPAQSLPAAMQLLERDPRPDAAVVDVKLRDVDCYALLDRLIDIGVPILLVTGYDVTAIASRYARLPRLEKPVFFHRVVEELQKMLSPTAGNATI